MRSELYKKGGEGIEQNEETFNWFYNSHPITS